MLAPISGIRGVAYGAEEGVHRLQFSEATGKMAIPVTSLRLISHAHVDHVQPRNEWSPFSIVARFIIESYGSQNICYDPPVLHVSFLREKQDKSLARGIRIPLFALQIERAAA